MEISGGCAGMLLHIDLSARHVSKIPLPDLWRGQLLGGKALAARLLLEHTDGSESAFSENAPVVIAAGLLTGTGAPASARFDVAALSPRDDRPAFSGCGGSFGVMLKRAGFDAMILTGRSERPLWLEISDGHVRFHDAGALRGMETGPCREALRQLSPDRAVSVLCIGPAGEHQVPFASLLADGHSMGRAGLGAVLGQKGLKAVTVSGTGTIPLHDPEQALSIIRRWNALLARSAPAAPAEGRCAACPLRCSRPGRGGNALADNLGLDAMEAEAVLLRASALGLEADDLLSRIARGEPIDPRLTDIVPGPKKSGARRKTAGFRQIRAAFSPPPETAEDFCRDLTEAVSACGQCIFTLNALSPGKEFLLSALLTAVTGRAVTLDTLLALGRYSRDLEAQLLGRFVP